MPLFEGAGEATVVANKLRESLRAQAVETAMLRQDLLGRKLTAKREVEFLKNRLAQTERDLVKERAAARTHKEDKDIQLSEMASTIRILGGRGEFARATGRAQKDVGYYRIRAPIKPITLGQLAGIATGAPPPSQGPSAAPAPPQTRTLAPDN